VAGIVHEVNEIVDGIRTPDDDPGVPDRGRQVGRLGGPPAVYLTIVLSHIGSATAGPLLPRLQDDFALSAMGVVLVVSVLGFARLATDLPFGRIVERMPVGRALVAGTAAAALGSAVTAVAPTFEILLLGRAVSGVGAAIVSITAIVALIDMSTPSNRGSVLGWYQVALQGGVSISPVVSGFVTELWDWRMAFLVAAGAGVVAGIAAVASGAGSRHVSAGTDAAAGPSTVTEPVRRVPIGAVHYLTFVLFLVSAGVLQTALPLYAGSELDLDAATIGLVLGVATAFRLLLSAVAGGLSDRIGRGAVILPALGLLVVSLLSLPLVANAPQFALATWGVAVGRVGNSLPTALLTDVAAGLPMGRLISTNRFLADLGSALGPLGVGFAIDRWGSVSIYPVSAAIVVTSVAATVVALRAVPRRSG
jgi:MFS family permease